MKWNDLKRLRADMSKLEGKMNSFEYGAELTIFRLKNQLGNLNAERNLPIREVVRLKHEHDKLLAEQKLEVEGLRIKIKWLEAENELLLGRVRVFEKHIADTQPKPVMSATVRNTLHALKALTYDSVGINGIDIAVKEIRACYEDTW